MKKGVLVSSVAALGLAGSRTATGTNQQETPRTGLVFVDSYDPGVPFTVISQVEQSTVNDIFGQLQDGATVIDPERYNGYVVGDQFDEEAHGELWFVFVQEATLETGQTYAFTDQVVFFSSELSLVEAIIQPVEGEAETPTPETTPEETTPTPEETTTTTPEETTTTTEEATPTPEETTPTPEETPITPEETTPANETVTTEEVIVETPTETEDG